MPIPFHTPDDWTKREIMSSPRLRWDQTPTRVFESNNALVCPFSVPIKLVFPEVEISYWNTCLPIYFLKAGSALQQYLHHTEPEVFRSTKQQVEPTEIATCIRRHAQERGCSVRSVVYCSIRLQGEQLPEEDFHTVAILESYLTTRLHKVRRISQTAAYKFRRSLLPALEAEGRVYLHA